MPKTVKAIKAPIRTPYRQQAGHKWYIYVLVGFASLCLMLSALVASLIISSKDDIPGNIFTKLGQMIAGDARASGDTQPMVGRDFNILIAGLDDVKGSKRSDTIIVGHISPRDKFANFVFVPRDTYVDVPRFGKQKINAAYALGGQNLLIDTLEEYLGVRIDYYAVVNVEAFSKFVDAMGGLDVNVEKRMKYRDRRGNLNIDLQAGPQHLDGMQVMQYARFRHDAEGDFGRIRRQQQLLELFSKAFRNKRIISRIPAMLNTLDRGGFDARRGNEPPMLDMNFSKEDIVDLGAAYDKTMSRNINHYALPGVPDMVGNMSVVFADETELPYLVGGALKGGYHPDNTKVKIQILNGCRQGGIADIFARRLGYYGFDIVNKDNADSFDYKKSVVVLHRDAPAGQHIAHLLDADLTRDIDPNAIADISVIIGSDKL